MADMTPLAPWLCNQCGVVNRASRRECVCGEVRPDFGQPPARPSLCNETVGGRCCSLEEYHKGECKP